MSKSHLQRELLRAGYAREADHVQSEEDGRFALAVFDAEYHRTQRAESEFLRFVTNGSHFKTGQTDAYHAHGTSTCYGQPVECSVGYVCSLAFELFDLARLDQSSREEFEQDYLHSLMLQLDSEALLGAIVEYSKYSFASCWSASIADPTNVQVPPSGKLTCNGPVILHATRCELLADVIELGEFRVHGRYQWNW